MVGKAPPELSLEAHLQAAFSWPLIEEGFAQIFPGHLKEIEGAPANRFFPRTLAWALPAIVHGGHFLDVRCGTLKKNAPCVGKRDELEHRVLAITLVRAMPTGRRPEELFDQKTWLLSAAGMEAFKAAEKRVPGLWQRLYVLAARAIGGRRIGAGPTAVGPAGPAEPE